VHLTGLDRFFWFAGFGAHLALLGVLISRRQVREFPIFSLFVLSNVARSAALYAVRLAGSRTEYFYAFWALGGLDTLLQLGVVYEMYSHTFRPLGEWPRDVRGAFRWLLAGSLGIAVALTSLAAPQTRLWSQAAVIKGNLLSAALMSEFLVGMIALSVRVGLPWKSYVARISQGFGAYSIVEVLIEAGHTVFGVGRDTRQYFFLSHIRISAYLVCVLYWMVTLWRRAPVSKPMPDNMRGLLASLQRAVDLELQSVRSRGIP
jgi:hypothetical protein